MSETGGVVTLLVIVDFWEVDFTVRCGDNRREGHETGDVGTSRLTTTAAANDGEGDDDDGNFSGCCGMNLNAPRSSCGAGDGGNRAGRHTTDRPLMRLALHAHREGAPSAMATTATATAPLKGLGPQYPSREFHDMV